MYGIFTNICLKDHPNVGKYTIHGAYVYSCVRIDQTCTNIYCHNTCQHRDNSQGTANASVQSTARPPQGLSDPTGKDLQRWMNGNMNIYVH